MVTAHHQYGDDSSWIIYLAKGQDISESYTVLLMQLSPANYGFAEIAGLSRKGNEYCAQQELIQLPSYSWSRVRSTAQSCRDTLALTNDR